MICPGPHGKMRNYISNRKIGLIRLGVDIKYLLSYKIDSSFMLGLVTVNMGDILYPFIFVNTASSWRCGYGNNRNILIFVA